MGAGTAQAQDVTIAALGDSLTQGYGLTPDAGFVAQLDRWLAKAGAEVTLINAGVSGDTTAGGLARVGWTLGGDVDAMIVALGGNDALRGTDPATSRSNLAQILQTAKDMDVPVLLVGITAPSNYGPDYKAEFDGMFVDLADEFGALYHPNFLRALTAEVDLATALDRYIQADGLHPNPQGVKLIVDDLGPSVLALIARASP